MTTIKIMKSAPIWNKTSFANDGDLLDYLLEKLEIGKLKSLPELELTDERKKDWDEVDRMDDDDFIDIR